jgi:hypothetical protein
MVESRPVGPLGQVANRIPVRSARSANEKKPWRDVETLEGVIESEFLYRTHLGETVLPFRALEPRTVVLPIDFRGRLLEGDVLMEYACLSEWMAKTEEVWEAGRKSMMTLLERINYHRELTDQFPIVERRIAYSKSGMHLSAARIDDHRAVIDHTLYWASVSSEKECWYLLAILNSTAVTKAVRPLMSYGKDERHIDKYVWQLPIPAFDGAITIHAELSRLGREAEAAIAKLPLEAKHFAAQRRDIRDWLESSKVGRSIEDLVSKLLKI